MYKSVFCFVFLFYWWLLFGFSVCFLYGNFFFFFVFQGVSLRDSPCQYSCAKSKCGSKRGREQTSGLPVVSHSMKSKLPENDRTYFSCLIDQLVQFNPTITTHDEGLGGCRKRGWGELDEPDTEGMRASDVGRGQRTEEGKKKQNVFFFFKLTERGKKKKN